MISATEKSAILLRLAMNAFAVPQNSIQSRPLNGNKMNNTKKQTIPYKIKR
jgi:hypothetical protein